MLWWERKRRRRKKLSSVMKCQMNGLRQKFWLEISKLVRACVHTKFMEKSQDGFGKKKGDRETEIVKMI